MKRILCYGDSNTWGYRPVVGGRYSEKERWPSLLKELTGYEIIEEGLNGRTTVFTDYLEPYRNGLEYAAPCVMSHLPLDLIIIMLGSNDTKRRYHVSASEIARGLGEVILQMRHYCGRKGADPEFLVIAPPYLYALEEENDFDKESEEKARRLEIEYEKLAKEMKCQFLRASDYVKDIGGDGVHLTAEGHKSLAEAVAQAIEIVWQ